MSAPSSFAPLPAAVAWRHREARDGFEVLFPAVSASGLQAQGRTTAVQDGAAWAVAYQLDVDAQWRTAHAVVTVDDAGGTRTVDLEQDAGAWRVDGTERPDLTGCVDVDLEASAFTNALPMHRLALDVGEEADAPAAFVTAAGEVELLEQHYRRLPDADGRRRFDYSAPRFDFRAVLVYDAAGLIVDYPGLAERIGLTERIGS